MSVGITQLVAEYISTAPRDVTGEAAQRAQTSILDAIGLAVLGSSHRVVRRIASVHDVGTEGTAPLLGTRDRASAPDAALLNAAAIHVHDWDDIGGCGGHPTSMLLPPLLSLAQVTRMRGEDLVDAYSVGYHVGSALAQLTVGEHGLGAPWHPSAVFGRLGAAAAMARALRLDRDRAAAAIAIAASQSAGNQSAFGTECKPFQLGAAARDGYVAARLAEAGVVTDPAALESPRGFLATFARGATTYEGFSDDLRAESYLVRSSAGRLSGGRPHIKAWPCCGSATPALTALEACRPAAIDPTEVEHVTVHDIKDRSVKGGLFRTDPQSGLEGKFSLSYVVAARLCHDVLDERAFEEGGFQRVMESGLTARVRQLVDADRGWRREEDADDVAVAVEVVLRDGRVIRGTSNAMGRTLTFDEAVSKLRRNCSDRLPKPQVDELEEGLQHVAGLADVRALTDAASRLSPCR